MAGKHIITAGGLIDGSGADVRRDVFLAVRNGIITDIGPAAQLPRDEGAAIDDLSHCIILPALVDCSISLARSPSVDMGMPEPTDPGEKEAMIRRHISYCHAHGVLGAADGEDITGLLPRTSGLSLQQGLMDIRVPSRLGGAGTGTAERGVGGDFLRILYSGSIEDENPNGRRLTREDLNRILEAKGDKKAVVVANGPQLVEEALEAGCDALEQGYTMGEDNLRRMAEEDVLWIPGILRARNSLDAAGSGGDVCCRFSLRYAAPGKAIPGAEAYWKKVLAEQLQQLQRAKDLGVRTAVGTGAGSVGILHGESMVEEMKLFIKAGYSLPEAVRCASENGAAFFGLENLGALAVGRKATFLVTRGTAKQLPRKLSYLEGIYINGKPSEAYRKNPVIKP